MMRQVLAMLLAVAIAVYPAVAVGARACDGCPGGDCTTQIAQAVPSTSSADGADACCSSLNATQANGHPDTGTDREPTPGEDKPADDRCPCPQSCCSALAKTPAAALQHRFLVYNPPVVMATHVEPDRLDADPHVPGLRRPPRTPSTV